ncbi:MAG: CorA family divalent cation transporter [Actinomycetota bacterium]
MEFRVYRDGKLEAEAFDARAPESLMAGPSAVWVDVVDPDPATLTELKRIVPALAEIDTGERGRPPKVKVVEDAAFVRAYATRVAGDSHLEFQEIRAVAEDNRLVTVRFGSGFDLSEVVRAWAKRADRGSEGGIFVLSLLLEWLVEDYFDIIDWFEERADAIDARVFDTGSPERSRRRRENAEDQRIRALERDIHALRGELSVFRRHILPFGELRELLQGRVASSSEQLTMDFRDIGDSIIRAVELLDNVRDQVTSSFEAVLAQVSNQLNVVMKKLTAWAAILLVPTLIAGIYGMNFEHMPELAWQQGYPFALGTIVGSSLLLYLYFKRKDMI